MKIIKNEKYRKFAIIISIPLLFILQYFLFQNGILRPMLKGVEIQIVNGEHIKDIDKYVIMLDETVELSMGKYIWIPSYSKEPNLTFKILDNSDIVYIEGNKMTGLKEGYTSIGVMNGSSLLKKATVKVVKPKVEKLEVKLDDNLVYVGDSSKISSVVEVDYKGFKKANKVTYESSNEDVLQIKNDTIHAVGVGTATIYAKSGDWIEQLTVNIRAKVASIEIDKNIEIEVGQVEKLSPRIVTSPINLKHPKIEYTLVGAKLPISRALALEPDGTIVGIREGEEEIKIRCGNKVEIITVKVNEISITNKSIENLEVTEEIVDNNLILTLTWDYLKGVNDYEVYMKNNLLNEKEFTAIKHVQVQDDELDTIKKVYTTIQIDITNSQDLDIELYVIGVTEKGETSPSNKVKIKYPKESESLNNLIGYFDKEANNIKLTWDPINIEGVTYSVYTKNILNNEDAFTLYENNITTNEFIIGTSEVEVELEVYVVASFNGKTVRSQTIVVK